jgi:hypothetical protein
MSTYTIHPRERAHHDATAWTLQHPAISTVAALAAAVLAGVLIGVLFNIVFSGTEATPQHRAGGHALAATINVAQPAAAASEDSQYATHIKSVRSPARGGFAVGRADGAGSGIIAIHVGTRAPARGGFSGRSLGAGRAPAAALMRSASTES